MSKECGSCDQRHGVNEECVTIASLQAEIYALKDSHGIEMGCAHGFFEDMKDNFEEAVCLLEQASAYFIKNGIKFNQEWREQVANVKVAFEVLTPKMKLQVYKREVERIDDLSQKLADLQEQLALSNVRLQKFIDVANSIKPTKEHEQTW